jgi:hypothetical protein
MQQQNRFDPPVLSSLQHIHIRRAKSVIHDSRYQDVRRQHPLPDIILSYDFQAHGFS